MLGIKKRDTKQVFKAIAHQQGVSVLEVKEHIQSTIDEMYYSDDPDVQAEFSDYFGKKRPTPKEYVYTMATKQLPCFFLIWSGKRDRYKTAQGGGENVKPSDFQKL